MTAAGAARTMGRRHFLALAGGAAGGAGLLAACGGSSPERPPDDRPVPTSPDHLEGDLSIAAL
ncbi:MAG: MBL fold metallo-hydrolase, partial [Actinomycetota bacterium]|nr:MBL fold metallo-hydrolase [Actinomycetota bacterium]